MYNFLYISPIKTLISTETRVQTKDNFSIVYFNDKNSYVRNYDNAQENSIGDSCYRFVQNNSIDYINTIDYVVNNLIKPKISRFSEMTREKERAAVAKNYELIDELPDNEYEEKSNEFNFNAYTQTYLTLTKYKLKTFRDFIYMSDSEIIDFIRESYIESLIANRSISLLNDTLFNTILEKIKSAEITLPFTKEDRIEVFYRELESEKNSYDYFFSIDRRVKSMDKYNYTPPTFQNLIPDLH